MKLKSFYFTRVHGEYKYALYMKRRGKNGTCYIQVYSQSLYTHIDIVRY